MKKQCFNYIRLVIIFSLTFANVPMVKAAEVFVPPMPKPGTMVNLSPSFTPAHLKGMTVHPENPLQFDFLMDKGEDKFSDEGKKEEYTKIIKYFLASLTIADKDQWVNLSPYENNRIIENNFGKTEMGRDLLAQDYLLKQVTSSLMYPESGMGKKFWDKVYERAFKKFGNTNVPVNTINKVWIMPDDAVVYESKNTALILKSHLKVMLEEDYLAVQKNNMLSPPNVSIGGPVSSVSGFPTKALGNDNRGNTNEIIRQIILPELEKEINEGKNFAQLRQIVSAMILATWYKQALKESILGKVYADQGKVQGVNQDPKANDVIYKQYLEAFKKGVYSYIKDDEDKYTKQIIPRKYFAGGFVRAENTMSAVTILKSSTIDLAQLSNYQIDGNLAFQDTFFGDGLDTVGTRLWDVQSILGQEISNKYSANAGDTQPIVFEPGLDVESIEVFDEKTVTKPAALKSEVNNSLKLTPIGEINLTGLRVDWERSAENIFKYFDAEFKKDNNEEKLILFNFKTGAIETRQNLNSMADRIEKEWSAVPLLIKKDAGKIKISLYAPNGIYKKNVEALASNGEVQGLVNIINAELAFKHLNEDYSIKFSSALQFFNIYSTVRKNQGLQQVNAYINRNTKEIQYRNAESYVNDPRWVAVQVSFNGQGVELRSSDVHFSDYVNGVNDQLIEIARSPKGKSLKNYIDQDFKPVQVVPVESKFNWKLVSNYLMDVREAIRLKKNGLMQFIKNTIRFNSIEVEDSVLEFENIDDPADEVLIELREAVSAATQGRVLRNSIESTASHMKQYQTGFLDLDSLDVYGVKDNEIVLNEGQVLSSTANIVPFVLIQNESSGFEVVISKAEVLKEAQLRIIEDINTYFIKEIMKSKKDDQVRSKKVMLAVKTIIDASVVRTHEESAGIKFMVDVVAFVNVNTLEVKVNLTEEEQNNKNLWIPFDVKFRDSHFVVNPVSLEGFAKSVMVSRRAAIEDFVKGIQEEFLRVEASDAGRNMMKEMLELEAQDRVTEKIERQLRASIGEGYSKDGQEGVDDDAYMDDAFTNQIKNDDVWGKTVKNVSVSPQVNEKDILKIADVSDQSVKDLVRAVVNQFNVAISDMNSQLVQANNGRGVVSIAQGFIKAGFTLKLGDKLIPYKIKKIGQGASIELESLDGLNLDAKQIDEIDRFVALANLQLKVLLKIRSKNVVMSAVQNVYKLLVDRNPKIFMVTFKMGRNKPNKVVEYAVKEAGGKIRVFSSETKEMKYLANGEMIDEENGLRLKLRKETDGFTVEIQGDSIDSVRQYWQADNGGVDTSNMISTEVPLSTNNNLMREIIRSGSEEVYIDAYHVTGNYETYKVVGNKIFSGNIELSNNYEPILNAKFYASELNSDQVGIELLLTSLEKRGIITQDKERFLVYLNKGVEREALASAIAEGINEAKFKFSNDKIKISDHVKNLLLDSQGGFARFGIVTIGERIQVTGADKVVMRSEAPKGGIDLNAQNFSLEIKRDGKGVALPISQQDMNMLNRIEGFVPQIIEIKPVMNLPILSELQEKIKSAEKIASIS